MSTPHVIANVGAEEGEGPLAASAEPRVATVAGLLTWLLDGPRPAWLPETEGLAWAWLNTEAAAAEAAQAGRRLGGALPGVVHTVHDKAFAARVAREERMVPACLREYLAVFDPDDLGPGAERRVVERVEAWPEWLEGRFTLKPRFGTSARGRVGGRVPGVDLDALRGGLPRLRERGGALLEPWLRRREDLSVQFYVGDEGVTLLGGLTQRTTPAGGVLGHTGTLDARGRVASASTHEEAQREAALALVLAARDAGYRGPAGVDAFVFEGPEGEPLLRPATELNARFTLGTIAVVAAKRMLGEARDHLGLRPGKLVPFALVLDAPDPPPDVIAHELPGEGLRPALWLAEHADAFAPAFVSEAP